MRYISRKLFKWNFSEENLPNNSKKCVTISTLWSNEVRSVTNMLLSSIPTRRHLNITDDNQRYLFETSVMTFTLYNYGI